MEIDWTDRVRNEVLQRVKEQRNILHTVKGRKDGRKVERKGGRKGGREEGRKEGRLSSLVTSGVGNAF